MSKIGTVPFNNIFKSANITQKLKICIKVEMDIATLSVQIIFYCGYCDAVCPNQTLPRISRRCLSRANYIHHSKLYISFKIFIKVDMDIETLSIQIIFYCGHCDAVCPNQILPSILRRCLSRANYIIHLQKKYRGDPT